MRTAIIPLALLASACASGVKMTDQTLPTCTSFAECVAHDGQRVHVIGVYTEFHVLPPKARGGEPGPIRIMFGDEKGPFLEPYWHAGALRPPDERARYLGKRVQVTGTFHKIQPTDPANPPEAAALGDPCIHPVEAVAPAP
jgi:hypothetical protein